jgi:hypothetical protein
MTKRINSIRITFRCNDKIREMLKELSEENQRSQNNYVNKLISDAYKKYKEGKE